jgi:hypothetical protein
LSSNNRPLKDKSLFNKVASTAGTNEFENESWNGPAVTKALELDLQMTGNKVLTLPLKALGFSEL